MSSLGVGRWYLASLSFVGSASVAQYHILKLYSQQHLLTCIVTVRIVQSRDLRAGTSAQLETYR